MKLLLAMALVLGSSVGVDDVRAPIPIDGNDVSHISFYQDTSGDVLVDYTYQIDWENLKAEWEMDKITMVSTQKVDDLCAGGAPAVVDIEAVEYIGEVYPDIGLQCAYVGSMDSFYGEDNHPITPGEDSYIIDLNENNTFGATTASVKWADFGEVTSGSGEIKKIQNGGKEWVIDSIPAHGVAYDEDQSGGLIGFNIGTLFIGFMALGLLGVFLISKGSKVKQTKVKRVKPEEAEPTQAGSLPDKPSGMSDVEYMRLIKLRNLTAKP